ncbi:MAG: hypothetical protein HY709_10840 [Candidatus Latescibacteria bacterium]|nr:hypothetical protein [Candidatus Latescibacterota bacterium]
MLRIVDSGSFRREPQGIHVALTEDLEHYDLEHEIVGCSSPTAICSSISGALWRG